MKLSFSTNAFTRYDLFQALEDIRAVGYAGVEIMADTPHLWPLDEKEEHYTRVSERARELGLAICNLNGFMMRAVGDIHHPSWIERDREARSIRRRHTMACIQAARLMGVPSVSTEPGGPVGTEDRAEALRLFAEELAEPAALAADLGVRLLIEPEPGLLLARLEETETFLRDHAPPGALGINYDLGHFFCEGEDPAALIRSRPRQVEHVHLEDIASNREHRHLIPGRGALDFPAVFRALRAVDYQGFVTVELYPYETDPLAAAEEAFRFLDPFIRNREE